MTWREDLSRVNFGGRKLVGASFRGVPFFVESDELGGVGRRAVVHEFPLRNDPFVEDLGRKARTFRIDGYVVGDDYLAQRDALLTALEVEGVGELVHPQYGRRRAVCLNASVRQTIATGGMAQLSIEFAEAPAQSPTPDITIDPVAAVGTAAAVAKTAAKAELVERFSAAGLPSFALASASGALTRASAGLGAAVAPIVTTTQELATLTSQLALLTAQASSLVRQPAGLFDAFDLAITALADTAKAAPGDLLDALLESYAVDLGPPVPATTSTRLREQANQAALNGALRRIMSIEAARLAPTVTYETIDAALTTRGGIAAALGEQAGGAGDTAYPSLVSLRAEVLRAVPGAGAFRRIVTINRAIATPSIVLAYQLYGSVDREADIIARNHVVNPAFIAGDLEVLSDG